MKKIILLTLTFTMTLCLSGCVYKDNKLSNESNTPLTKVETKTETIESKTVESKTVESQTPETKTVEETEQTEEKEQIEKTEQTEEIEPVAVNEQENTNVQEENIIKRPPSSIKTVVIDPGHGPGGNSAKELQSPDSSIMKIKDGGGAEGINSKTPEYIITMSVSLKLKNLLEANGINVVMTKDDINLAPGNIERADVGNNNNADLSIRIHCDSADISSAKGASMLVPAPVGYAENIAGISRTYGEIILNDLVSTVGMYNRGVIERSDLTGFNWSKVPVVLIEMGFLSNPEEDNLLNSDSYQDKLAQGLCNGILKALGE